MTINDLQKIDPTVQVRTFGEVWYQEAKIDKTRCVKSHRVLHLACAELTNLFAQNAGVTFNTPELQDSIHQILLKVECTGELLDAFERIKPYFSRPSTPVIISTSLTHDQLAAALA